ncbi:MAG: SRPBCC family protein [Gemmatimonadota bacterium]
MLILDETTAQAPPEICFRIAADVESWPSILPHYRWVQFQRKEGFAQGRVEMAAWRDFLGPLKYPTWWLSEMRHDREKGHVYCQHVKGVTRGMEVRWEVVGLPDGTSHIRLFHEWDGPAWPAIGGLAAKLVILPHFVSFIAQRTLAGVARAAEARAAGPRSAEAGDAGTGPGR